MIDVVLLNGTVGAGKSTTATAISRALGGRGVVHAVIDLDAIRLLVPAPAGDPYQHEVELVNLRDLAHNYRAAGASRLVLAGVVEDAVEVDRYRSASGAAGVLLVRLTEEPDELEDRLRRRHADDVDGMDWHLRRAPELARIQRAAAFDELVVSTTGRTPDEVASEVVSAAGWDGIG